MSIDKAVDSTQLDTDLTTVANAIRSKGGTSAQLSFPAGMAQAIAAIQTGITPSGNIALSPTTSAQTGIDVSGYATASVVAITAQLLSSLDSDFKAENIKKDVDLFGLVGTLEGGGGSSNYVKTGEITRTSEEMVMVEVYTIADYGHPDIVILYDEEYVAEQTVADKYAPYLFIARARENPTAEKTSIGYTVTNFYNNTSAGTLNHAYVSNTTFVSDIILGYTSSTGSFKIKTDSGKGYIQAPAKVGTYGMRIGRTYRWIALWGEYL